VEQWIQSTLAADQLGLAVIPAAFLFGVLGSVSSCCSLPVIGVVVGYAGTLSGQREHREILLVGLAVMIGTILSLAALGAVFGFIGGVVGATMGRYWRVTAGLLMVVFGLFSMDLLHFRAPRLGHARPSGGRTVAGALLYGFALGGGTTACSFGCNPLLPMALGAAVVQGATFLGAVMLAVFAIGYSLPLAAGLVGIGFGLGRLGRAARRVIPAVRVAGGLLMLGVGFFMLARP